MKYGIKVIASAEKTLEAIAHIKTDRGYEAWCLSYEYDNLNIAYQCCNMWHKPGFCYYVVEEKSSS